MEEEKDLSEDFSDGNSREDENKSAISADLIRGHINTIILRTLYDRDKYGNSLRFTARLKDLNRRDT